MDISVEAVRGRIKRGTIDHERDGGTVYVFLNPDQAATGHDQDHDHDTDRTGLVDLMREQIEDLRSDRDAWREQARRSDYLLGSAMERTRELENRLRELEQGPTPGPSEPRVSPESPGPTDTPTEARARPETEAQQPQRTPWWRRIFGG